MIKSRPQDQRFEIEHTENIAVANSDDPLLEGHPLSSQRKPRIHDQWKKVLPWVVHSILLSTSLALFFSGNSSYKRYSGAWPPTLLERNPTHTVRFHGNLEHVSPFKGPPSKAVEGAWDRIAPLAVIGISEEVYASLNASKHAVKVPPEAGSGYMGVFEGIHLVHCVRSLWETTYPEYYTDQHTLSIEKPDEWHAHLDHCADMLRQKLMCDADHRVVTYNWIKNHYAPKPNFNVQHQCRNYEQLLDITAKQKLDGTKFENGWILRPLDRPVVEFEQPPFDPDADA